MEKRIFVFMMIFLTLFLGINMSYATNQVDVTAHIYKDFTIFNYIFEFDANESLNKFSIEKPKDIELDYLVDKDGAVDYEMAGDYIIVDPEDIEDNVFLLKYKSISASQNIYEIDSIKTYIGFDFSADVLNFELNIHDDFGEIIDIFPVPIKDVDNTITWQVNNTEKYSLFVVNFKETGENPMTGSKNDNEDYGFYLALVIALPLLLFLLFMLFLQYKNMNKQKENKQKEEDKKKQQNAKKNKAKKITKKSKLKSKIKQTKILKQTNQQIESNITIEPISELSINFENKSQEEKQEEEKEKIFKEILEKHLTDNEQDVLKLIKKEEGIAQQDILNNIPTLTKSNLSKIIAKLNARKIVNRIRVGKINKIYLGSKFQLKEE